MTRSRLLLASIATLILSGCKPKENVEPALAAAGPSALFAKLAQEPKGSLRAQLEAALPHVEWRLGSAGPLPLPAADGNLWDQHEISVSIGKSTRPFAEDRPKVVAELDRFLKAMAQSAGVELRVEEREQKDDSKKVDLRYDYVSGSRRGVLRIGPQPSVATGVLITVSER